MRRFEVFCKVRRIIRTETAYTELAPFLSVGLWAFLKYGGTYFPKKSFHNLTDSTKVFLTNCF